MQIEVLRQQLELAKELNKPASVHFVSAFGVLLELMKYEYLFFFSLLSIVTLKDCLIIVMMVCQIFELQKFLSILR